MTRTSAFSARFKRAIDLLVSFTGLIAILPLLLVVALAVWIGDRGPVLFSQARVGANRRDFRVIKFRTMVVHAERTTGPVWSWSGDPRITRIGRFLRTTHLDELPQLWNVLRGEMSLVGPRPERAVFVEQLEQVIPGYSNRFDIRPGITGLSQLRSGYDESVRTVRRKTRYDRLYVSRSCTLLDTMILVDTFLGLFGLSGALGLRKAVVRRSPAVTIIRRRVFAFRS